MAGDWTPFRHDLIDDPAVMRMSSILSIPRQHVIGCLYCVWTWFDRHTVDGNAVGVTEVEIDALAAHGTFARAMQSVSWLVINGDGCAIPNFDRWMSKSAKKRVNTAKRVATHRKRKCNADVTPAALPENRTEQNKTETKLKNPPTPQRSARKNGAPKMNGSANNGFLIGPISNGNDAPLSANALGGDKPPSDQEVAPQVNETLNWDIAKKAGVEPFRYIIRAFVEVGLDEKAACELAAKVWSRPDVAEELANRCVEVKPDNPTGWMITRLRERKLIGR